jgi:hypothetical protein
MSNETLYNNDAGVAQLVEHLPSKQDVVGSSPIARSVKRDDRERFDLVPIIGLLSVQLLLLLISTSLFVGLTRGFRF